MMLKKLNQINLTLPIILLAVIFDRLFLHGQIQKALPYNFEDYFFITILFVNPHIIWSLLTFADTDYIKHYKKDFFDPPLLMVFIVIPIILAIWNMQFFAVYLAVLTLRHLLNQQYGIAGAITGHYSHSFSALKYINFAFQVPFLLLYVNNLYNLGFGQLESFMYNHPIPYLIAYLGITASLTIYIMMQMKDLSLRKRWYFFTSTASFPLAAIIFLMGYTFLAIAILRVMHDLTAELFYYYHDKLRNQSECHNFLYHIFGRALPTTIIAISLAFILAALVTTTQLQVIAPFLGFTHYFVEGFMWKRKQEHMKYIPSIFPA